MPAVHVRVKVEDYAKWRPVAEGMSSFRASRGSKGARVFQNVDDPNEVVLLFEWDDLDVARQTFQSDEAREAMRRAGVIPPANMVFLNEVEGFSG